LIDVRPRRRGGALFDLLGERDLIRTRQRTLRRRRLLLRRLLLL